MTLRSFIDGEGEALVLEEIDELARHLVRLMPVLRLRDARFMRRIHNGTVPHSPQIEITARQLDFLSRELVSHPQIYRTVRSVRGYRPWCNCLSITLPSKAALRRGIA